VVKRFKIPQPYRDIVMLFYSFKHDTFFPYEVISRVFSIDFNDATRCVYCKFYKDPIELPYFDRQSRTINATLLKLKVGLLNIFAQHAEKEEFPFTDVWIKQTLRFMRELGMIKELETGFKINKSIHLSTSIWQSNVPIQENQIIIA